MPDNAPNRGDNDNAVSSDDRYSKEEDLLIIGLAIKTLKSQGNKKRLHFPTPAKLTSEANNLPGCIQRAAAHHFGISQSSVSRIMATGLKAFADIHRTFIIQPEPIEVCHKPITKPKYQYFFGYIGAIDSTYIAAWVLKEGQRKKSLITQNILYAVCLNGTFSYVLAGCEGSVNDASLLRYAWSKSLKLYADRFYVRDAGFGAYIGLLVLLEGPQNKEELYNLRHSRLQIIVKLTFNWVKRKFRIIRSLPPEYDIYKQILIVYAYTGL
ncbi:hypothetical protein CEK25_003212 [Fusarium fujikuroi]|nr:hypothetical protein CEK25_003212 [Fusarium fujikuroi]